MSLVKRLVKVLLAWPPLWRLVTALRWRNRIIVLMYHKVVADGVSDELTISQFRSHLHWLARTCDIITPEQFINLSGQRRLRGRPRVLLTFDDAFISVRDRVYPALRERGLKGLVFVPSDPVMRGSTIWPQWHHDLFLYGNYESLPAFDAQGSQLAPADLSQRRNAEQQVRQRLKRMGNRQRQDALAALGRAAHWDDSQLQPESRLMSWEDLRVCADVFVYGGHTHTHPIMSSISADAQRLEVQTCAAWLEKELAVSPCFFAYPNGERGDFNEASLAALRDTGYEWAFTTQEGLFRLGDDPLMIRRLPTWAPRPSDLAWIIATAS